MSEGLLPPLERLLEMGLETGRIRQVHTAHGEMAAIRVFQRTPRGSAMKATCDAANEALRSLQGQSLEGLAFAVRGPGAFSLTRDGSDDPHDPHRPPWRARAESGSGHLKGSGMRLTPPITSTLGVGGSM